MIGLARDIFNLNRRVEGHNRQIGELADSVRDLSADDYRLSERILRLELQLEHQKEQQAIERENFRLQLENLMLRSQRGLPPRNSVSSNIPPTDEEP